MRDVKRLVINEQGRQIGTRPPLKTSVSIAELHCRGRKMSIDGIGEGGPIGRWLENTVKKKKETESVHSTLSWEIAKDRFTPA